MADVRSCAAANMQSPVPFPIVLGQLVLIEFTRMQATNRLLTINNTGVISYF